MADFGLDAVIKQVSESATTVRAVENGKANDDQMKELAAKGEAEGKVAKIPEAARKEFLENASRELFGHKDRAQVVAAMKDYEIAAKDSTGTAKLDGYKKEIEAVEEKLKSEKLSFKDYEAKPAEDRSKIRHQLFAKKEEMEQFLKALGYYRAQNPVANEPEKRKPQEILNAIHERSGQLRTIAAFINQKKFAAVKAPPAPQATAGGSPAGTVATPGGLPPPAVQNGAATSSSNSAAKTPALHGAVVPGAFSEHHKLSENRKVTSVEVNGKRTFTTTSHALEELLKTCKKNGVKQVTFDYTYWEDKKAYSEKKTYPCTPEFFSLFGLGDKAKTGDGVTSTQTPSGY